MPVSYSDNYMINNNENAGVDVWSNRYECKDTYFCFW